MRITGGIIGGRRILVPKTAIRPTQDRVRAAIFSSLCGRIARACVLDIFAGSGAMGLEAFSRGASFVCLVESDPDALRVLRENVARLCHAPFPPENVIKVVRNDAMRFLRRRSPLPGGPGAGRSFDIIFADPPYDRDGARVKKILSALSTASMLETGGLLVMEQEVRAPVPAREGWRIVRNKAYGGTRVCFFMKET